MHAPVMLEETLSSLITSPDGVYVDCTLGGGGHLAAIAAQTSSKARIIGIDKDQDILSRTSAVFNDPRITLIHGDFRNLRELLGEAGIEKVEGILIDLGVSSFQLDEADRGFSFHEDAGLDMRMDRSQPLNAFVIVNEWEESELARIIFEYGEERYSRRIARAIIRSRSVKPVQTTLELVNVIKSAVPGSYKGEKHPARKTFQALRIAVNDELGALEAVLPQAVELLAPGGRLAIISFHSLEDRMVKLFYRSEADPCTCPKDIPMCVCKRVPRVRLLKRKAITASEEELMSNPRASSAHLRVLEKIEE